MNSMNQILALLSILISVLYFLSRLKRRNKELKKMIKERDKKRLMDSHC